MKESEHYTSGITLPEGRKNRGWEDAVAAQFPELVGRMSRRKKFLLAGGAVLSLVSLYVLTVEGYRYYRQKRRERAATVYQMASGRLEEYLRDRSTWDNSTTQFGAPGEKLAKLAEQNPSEAYGLAAALLLAKSQFQEVNHLTQERLRANPKKYNRKLLPPEVESLGLVGEMENLFAVTPHSAEEKAYRQGLEWLQFAKRNAKDTLILEYLTIRIARVLLAMGQFKASEQEFLSIKNPVLKAYATPNLVQLYLLTSDREKAIAALEQSLQTTEKLLHEASEENLGQELYGVLADKKAQLKSWLEAVKSQREVQA